MKPGDKVNVMGVHRSLRVECDDTACQRKHYEDHELRSDVNGRYHYEDGPVESIAAVVAEGQGKPSKIYVEIEDGTVLHVDRKDVTT